MACGTQEAIEGMGQVTVEAEFPPNHVESEVDLCPNKDNLVTPTFECEGMPSSSRSSSSCSHRNMYRFSMEMNIETKGARESPLGSSEDRHQIPVKVMVDYPEDLTVNVNARIHRMINTISTPHPSSDGKTNGNNKTDLEILDMNQNSVLNSTFVKVPLSSTMIYPIVEEVETSNSTSMNQSHVRRTPSPPVTGDPAISPQSGSVYHTVLYESRNVGDFGNLSAINNGKIVDDRNPPGESLLGKHPSVRLNKTFENLQSAGAEVTPGQKLRKALHILARYRGVWGLFEEEARIEKHLSYINTLLATSDKTTIYETCSDEDYLELKGLISYFTMEKRFSIRTELMTMFTLISKTSGQLAKYICASEVPIILASEIQERGCQTMEFYAYSSYMLQMLSDYKLSKSQCDLIGKNFYRTVCEKIVLAESKQYSATSRALFDLLLNFHRQLGESDLMWQSLSFAAENPAVLLKLKRKFTNILLENGSFNHVVEGDGRMQTSDGARKIQAVLQVFMDMIVCCDTRELFSDAELDLIMLSLIHKVDEDPYVLYFEEALKTIHRILKTIECEPSGMCKLERLVTGFLNDENASGDYSSCFRKVLKGIYKIVTEC